MNKYLLVLLIAGLISIAGIVYINNKTSQQAPIVTEEVAKKQDNPIDTKIISHYEDYSITNLSNAIDRSDRTVLFFAALGWCPSCQIADKEFKANLGKIPNDVTILVVNYDTEKAFKQRYAVTMQDTFIQIDKNEREITRWNSGGQGVEALLANIK
ncbi:hypothetical protein COY90_00655 [Candidatus Roizmanbacteria bacterium CG_4_10_14_0_8_um_filter_39_9]|uniref:Thioredoxin domain-containing protein n=1 Tax=Candidatus Roizmanbacteria bacterium CG_4_10_14_0_8_um_filter_39_9 TaxID=1974829 RepID=A0A2M7QEX1_9BACT|nr:MAG: hypothetical protein COY90_00655 [Candidatus Roizmanbacteria bacterium CG_4_10_14_0_8_um_filter_39_9]